MDPAGCFAENTQLAIEPFAMIKFQVPGPFFIVAYSTTNHRITPWNYFHFDSNKCETPTRKLGVELQILLCLVVGIACPLNNCDCSLVAFCGR